MFFSCQLPSPDDFQLKQEILKDLLPALFRMPPLLLNPYLEQSPGIVNTIPFCWFVSMFLQKQGSERLRDLHITEQAKSTGSTQAVFPNLRGFVLFIKSWFYYKEYMQTVERNGFKL